MSPWFGKSWGAPICEPATRVHVPVGLVCPECDEPIGVRDQGMTMPFYDGSTVTTMAYHLDCWLHHILPHGPECERCRGLERHQHAHGCAYTAGVGNCDCQHGRDMARLFDPKTTLAELHEMAERIGISRQQLEDVGRLCLDHVESLKRRRAAHNPGDDPGKRKA